MRGVVAHYDRRVNPRGSKHEFQKRTNVPPVYVFTPLFSPGDAGITVSADRTIAQINGMGSGYQLVNISPGYSTGARYFEMLVGGPNGAGAFMIGFYPPPRSYTGALGYGGNEFSYQSGGQLVQNGFAASSGRPTYGPGDVIGIAADLNNRNCYFYKNGALVGSISFMGTFNPAASMFSAGSSLTMRVPTAIPSGSVAWS